MKYVRPVENYTEVDLANSGDSKGKAFNGAGRVAGVAEEIVFSLANERSVREKLQSLQGRALSKASIIIA